MRILCLLLSIIPLFALSNRITLYNPSVTAITSEPRTDTRGFADGEFCTGSYPAPYVSGTVSSSWQVDVLNNWDSGCIRQAKISYVVSIGASSNVDVDFRANMNPSSTGSTTPLDKTAMLAFNSSGWGMKVQGTASSVVKSASARTILAAVSECPTDEWVPAGCFKYLLRGPVVTQILLFAGTTNSFGWECDSGGGTCPAVSPYTSTVWKSPTSTSYDSVHTIYYLSFYTGFAGVKEELALENVWFHRGQDLRFDLEIFNGGAETTSVYTSTGLVFYAWRRAKFAFWDGAAPVGWVSQYRPGVRVDYNRQYLLYARLTPFLAPEVDLIGTAATYDYDSSGANLDVVHNIGTAPDAQFCNGAGTTCGPQQYSWPSGGTKPDIGPLSRSYSRYIASFSADMYDAMLQIGLMAGAFPLHVREDSTTLAYRVGSAVKAFGKPISIDARPQIRLGTYQLGAPVGSRFVMGDGVVGNIQCAEPTRSYQIGCTNLTNDATAPNRWTVDDAHPPRAAYIPYVITGDEYLREEQQFAATQVMGVGSESSTVAPGCVSNFARHGESTPGLDWGLPGSTHNIRVDAWWSLHVGQTVLSLPAGSAERLYYESKLNNQINVRRGSMGIPSEVADRNPGGTVGDPCPSGSYNPATATPWCYGYVSLMERKANPMALTSIQGTYSGWGLSSAVAACASNQWFEHYMLTSYGLLNDLGLTKWFPVVKKMGEGLIRRATQGNALPAALGDYSVIMRKVSDSEPVQTVAEVNAAIMKETTLRADVTSGDTVLPLNHQVVSTNCTSADSIWMGGITKWVIDPGLANEEWIELNSSPSCQTPGNYTVTPNKRGAMGTTAVAHTTGAIVRRGFLEYGSTASTGGASGYGNIAQGAFSFAYPFTTTDEVTGARLTGKRAWQVNLNMKTYQDWVTNQTCSGISTVADGCQNLMWQFRPRHLIENLVVKPGTGQVQFWYVAPTMDACRIGMSLTPFPTSNDSGDTVSTGLSIARTLTIGSLSAGTYNYRITCGPYNGTSRTFGTVVVP